MAVASIRCDAVRQPVTVARDLGQLLLLKRCPVAPGVSSSASRPRWPQMA